MNPLRRGTAPYRMSTASLLVWSSYLFMLIGVAALAYAGYVLASARTYQAVETSRFKRAVSRPETRREPRLVTDGGVIGRMEIPRLGLSAIVVQGDSSKVLRRAVGHIPETALPGESGNVALAGHRDTLFRPLRRIQLGDAITLRTPDGEFQYRVESTRVVPPDATEVLQSSGVRELTLITCFPFDYIGSAPNRFVVRAREIGPPAN